jgi:thiamine pyrophosphate-dependent acetolactate synthase large subunit-like protein
VKRWEALDIVVPKIEGALTVVCNGMLGRDLWATGDRPEWFYMIGSMGLASSIGLGLSVTQPEKRVVVLDGDGNVLMNMGGLANIGTIGPRNFYHLVFDNGVHASTGGQRTISHSLPLEEVARVCGYRRVRRADDPEAVATAVEELLAGPGPAMLLIEVEPGNQKDVPRVEVTPEEMAARMRIAATGSNP